MSRKRPTENQRRILADLPDVFTAKNVDKKAYGTIVSAFHLRGWTTSEVCADPTAGTGVGGGGTGGRVGMVFRLTDQGKADRAEAIKGFGLD